jgi:hypothetical protein
MRFCLPAVASVALMTITACATHQTGPNRSITIADDVALARELVERNLSSFYGFDATRQGMLRNEILTARMFIVDVEYHDYEARLTKEIQQEGLAATLASLGLTTSATLLSPPGTKTILSGVATAVTGADKAYNEKILLSNTIQALQTQMRADRKEQAAVIYAKMFKADGMITPIGEYTLSMALSDVGAYYQAGTIASALIGLSRTVATKEVNSDHAKAAAGPNPRAVTGVKVLASPPTAAITSQRPGIIRDVSAPLKRFTPPPPPPSETRIGAYEKGMQTKDMRFVLDVLCRPRTEGDLGVPGSPARKALAKFLADNQRTSVETLDRNAFIDVQELNEAGKKGC